MFLAKNLKQLYGQFVDISGAIESEADDSTVAEETDDNSRAEIIFFIICGLLIIFLSSVSLFA